MLLSQITADQLTQLSEEQKKKIIFMDQEDDGLSYDAVLVLGGRLCEERASAAAQLYKAGRASCFVPTGGVEWERGGEKISEALCLARLMQEYGVPGDAIIVENEARSTAENMLYGTVQIQRRFRFAQVHRVCVVTSDWHLKRSVGLAQTLLPRIWAVSGYTAGGSDPAWLAYYLERELPLLHRFVQIGLIPDIEF